MTTFKEALNTLILNAELSRIETDLITYDDNTFISSVMTLYDKALCIPEISDDIKKVMKKADNHCKNVEAYEKKQKKQKKATSCDIDFDMEEFENNKTLFDSGIIILNGVQQILLEKGLLQ